MIREIPNYYYNIFKDYVTDDYREYLEITYNENEESSYTDGSHWQPTVIYASATLRPLYSRNRALPAASVTTLARCGRL